MMTSSNGNIFRVTGHFCAKFTGFRKFHHKGQWRGALMFSLICISIDSWLNNREAGDLRCHYAVTVMVESLNLLTSSLHISHDIWCMLQVWRRGILKGRMYSMTREKMYCWLPNSVQAFTNDLNVAHFCHNQWNLILSMQLISTITKYTTTNNFGYNSHYSSWINHANVSWNYPITHCTSCVRLETAASNVNFPPCDPKVNTLRPTQNGRHFPNDIFKSVFLNENV